MNKLSCCILLILFVHHISIAQAGLGVESGLNIFKPDIRKTSDIYARSDVNTYLGISPHYRFSHKVSIGIDFKYSRLGLKAVHFDRFEKRNRYDYFSITQKFEYKAHKHIQFGLGMYYSTLLGSHGIDNSGEWSRTTGSSTVLSADIGIVGSIKFLYRNFYLTTGYQVGLQDLNAQKYNETLADDVTDYDLYTRNVQIGVGYVFKI